MTDTTTRREAVHVMQSLMHRMLSAKQYADDAHGRFEAKANHLLAELRDWRTKHGVSAGTVAAALNMTMDEFHNLETGEYGYLSLLDDGLMRAWYHAIRLPYIDDRWYRDGTKWVIESPLEVQS